jgi:hydroxyacylglutathione hydrolase
MIQIKTFCFNPFQENTYILFDETKECVIIDPGCYYPEEEKELSDFIADNKLIPKKLLNTHCHIDHVFGNKYVADTYSIGLEMHKLDLFNLENVKTVSEMYGINGYKNSPMPVNFLDEGITVSFGNSAMNVLFTPGHAPGHITFVLKEQKAIISGDVLFYGSVGRTDFPGCSHEDLISSIKNKLFPLGDDFTVYCGHGPKTNIGFEKQNNPFIN